MGTFDIAAAKSAGYSDEEIQQFIQQQGNALGVTSPSSPRGQMLTAESKARGNYDPNSPEFQERYGPLSGMSDFEKVAAGYGQGGANLARQAGNVVGLVPNSAIEDAARVDAPGLADPSFRFGSNLGTTADLIPATMGAEALAGAAGPTAAILRSPVLTGALEGSGQGALLAGPGNRGMGAVTGAVTGGALPAVGKLASTATYGLRRTPEAQYLINRGVDLTPGQMYPQGTWNQMEQGAEHLPIVSGMTESAREGAENDWQRAVFQQAAAPGATINKSANMPDMLEQAYRSYEPLYAQAKGQQVLPAIMNGGQGIKLSAAFGQIAKMPGTTQDAQQAAGSWLQNELTRIPNQGRVMSDDLLDLRSNIRAQLRQARLSNDTIAQDKAQIFSAADQAVTRALQSQLAPQKFSALQMADQAYGKYKVVENAVAASKDQLAGLTPQKLSQAIYNATPDQQYALGAGGELRNLAQAGATTFRQKVPPTGAAALTMAAAALPAAKLPFLSIPAGIGGALTTLTPGGRALAQGVTRPQQGVQSLVSALQANTPQISRELAAQYARAAINRDPRAQAAARGALTLPLMALPGALSTQQAH